MAARIELLAREYAEKYPELAKSLRDSARLAIRLGVEPFTPVTPELLEAEVERQAGRYKGLEFHKHKSLRISVGRLKDQIMSLVYEQPEVFRGRFDIPVVVFGQISPKDQARLAGLNYYLDGLGMSDWEHDPQGYKTPETSYMTWIQDGTVNLGKSVEDVRKALAEDERGATIHDGIALYIANPDVLKDHFIDLPGTRVGSVSAPVLYLWDGGPGLDCRVGDADSGFGSASCGRV